MKKIITTATFLVFGTMLTMAQTTKKKETKSTTTRTEMRAKSTVQQNNTNNTPKMVDTTNLEQRQKEADEKMQRQTIPQKDGLNNEAVKPAQTVPTELE
ncbi:hypothetical protein LUD75_17585 [Epilithonimonas sp. JDS]|uniref:hypothetical protein n=1 Tax=Epilithonimonas sp. JDS TaxID=2902797 RepID=UPI001E54198B|nr:hypothetical protein [Epilithonimonas sp. JDS]MCD9856538.1 hypothetical protein [Epilithonimonas sp. JDS]